MIDPVQTPIESTRVPILLARRLSHDPRYVIHWRPEPHLYESMQYALVYEVL